MIYKICEYVIFSYVRDLIVRQSFIGETVGNIYKITNCKNNRQYVGLTTMTIEDRWKLHIVASRRKKSTAVLSKAIRKYGEASFDVECLEVCETALLREREKFWIAKEKTHLDHGGYNMTLGGDGLLGYRHTEETKKKMSESRMGKKNHNYGKVWGKTEWTIEERAEQSRKKMGKSWGTHSDEAKTKISTALRKRIRKVTPVTQLDLAGKEIQRFESAQHAAKHVGGQDHNILACCKGYRATHKKCMWRYASLEV